ncbi:MAG: 2-polyprenylphenol 6-hydroxylase [Pseudomonadota bacterium]
MPFFAFARILRAGFVMAREGVFGLVEPPGLSARARFGLRIVRSLERRGVGDRDAAERLSTALARLGPSYVKVGQFLATRPDVVGPAAARDLGRLQDSLPPFSQEEAEAMIEDSFGRKAEEVFQSLSPPIAAASIAQVHVVEIERDGRLEKAAVKILRPDVEARFVRDLESFYLAANWAERLFPPLRRLRPIAVVDTLASWVSLEMDFRLEAAAISEIGENSRDDPDFRVPAVDWDRCSKTVLTTEWVNGIKMSDLDAIRAAGHDGQRLARVLIQTFLRQAVHDGFFHADMHQGNLFVADDGAIVAVDFGITGRLNADEQRFLAEILFGFIRRDYRRVAEVHFEAGYVPRSQDVERFAQALRAIGEPLHGHTAAEISMARLLSQLLEVTELFQMHTQTRLILLQKTMVVVEGVARTLDPNLDMWATAEPVISKWMVEELGPAGRLREAGEGLSAVGRLLRAAPVVAERVERISADLETMTEDGLRLDANTIDSLARAQARHQRFYRLGFWVLAAALIGVLVFK